MKAMIKNIVYGIFITASGLLVGACSDDESNDPYDINYGFLYAPEYTDHSIAYIEDGTLVKSVDEIEKLVQVRCTRPAPTDLNYTISLDKSLVDTYNQKHGTDYVFLENARLLQSTLSIKKGEYISKDTLKVSYSDLTEFTNGKEKYLLPVTIASIDDGGVELSESRTIYLTYQSKLIIFEDVQAPVGKEIEDHSGWSVSLNGNSTTKLTDKNTSSYEYLTDGSVVEVDLGKSESLNTIGLTFYTWYYKCSDISITLSTDGQNFERLGDAEFESSTASHYIHLFKAKQARYVRITFNGYYYSSDYGAYLRELYFWAAE